MKTKAKELARLTLSRQRRMYVSRMTQTGNCGEANEVAICVGGLSEAVAGPWRGPGRAKNIELVVRSAQTNKNAVRISLNRFGDTLVDGRDVVLSRGFFLWLRWLGLDYRKPLYINVYHY